jgi:hypothetical protein
LSPPPQQYQALSPNQKMKVFSAHKSHTSTSLDVIQEEKSKPMFKKTPAKKVNIFKVE